MANTGLSVSQDDIDRLFQPFQRLGNDRTTHPGGHGLGLSIVRAVVAAHEAGLKIQLRPDGGLIVRIYFPLSPVGLNGHRDTAVSATADIQRVRKARSPIEMRRDENRLELSRTFTPTSSKV